MQSRSPRAVQSRLGAVTCLSVLAGVLAIGAWGWSTSGVVAGANVLRGSGASDRIVTSGSQPRLHTSKSDSRDGRSFTISGNVGGLYPGATVPLTLDVTNGLSRSIVVVSITTAVAGSRVCNASNVVVSNFSGRLPVTARRSAHVIVEVTMVHSAPMICQGQRFTFHYRGWATSS
jgi:hypothetical protein